MRGSASGEGESVLTLVQDEANLSSRSGKEYTLGAMLEVGMHTLVKHSRATETDRGFTAGEGFSSFCISKPEYWIRKGRL
jgi:hypothetical protein